MTDVGTREPARLRTSDNASDPAVSWKVKCLNCGAALAGPFCAECGQRALPPHPTVRELAGDALQEVSGWDGKFADTIRTLIRVPGELTRQWVEGRRAHFISPIRLYLTLSLIYFVVAGAAPKVGKSPTVINVGGADVVGGKAEQSRPERVGEATERALTTGKALTKAERDSALADIAKAPPLMRPMLTKAVDDPKAIQTGMMRWIPRVLFALLPVYAVILSLFYRRRNYPEHLFFAVHLHAFVFLALMFSALVKFSRSDILASIAGVGVAAWVVGYSVVALRRVYGGSIGMTILKGAGIMTLYGMIVLPALVLAVLLAAF